MYYFLFFFCNSLEEAVISKLDSNIMKPLKGNGYLLPNVPNVILRDALSVKEDICCRVNEGLHNDSSKICYGSGPLSVRVKKCTVLVNKSSLP